MEFIVRYARICPFVPLLFIQVAEELSLLLLGEGNVYAITSDIKAGDGCEGNFKGDFDTGGVLTAIAMRTRSQA